MEPKYYKVKDHTHLIKHADSKAILNVNDTELNKYKIERDKLLRQARLLDEVDSLKEDVRDIKDLLKKLLEREAK
jgi:hypothetical protein